MKAVADTTQIKTITTHDIDGGFLASQGQEMMDIVRPTDATVIARVTLGDEEDTRRVINGMTDDPQAPGGGFKFSGVGREYGRYGIEAFLETRAILES
jgi:acyl-CoA reductase-like NAD-dependent aldehyde dehydrogenase